MLFWSSQLSVQKRNASYPRVDMRRFDMMRLWDVEGSWG